MFPIARHHFRDLALWRQLFLASSSFECCHCRHAYSNKRLPIREAASGERVIRIPIQNKYILRVICSDTPNDVRNPPESKTEPSILPSHAQNIPTEKHGSPESTASTNTETIVKVKPMKKKPDPGLKYRSNVFITPLRAMREYLLTPSELSSLWSTTRRSPYADSPPVIAYLRNDVEKKAIEKFGSLEKLEAEKQKAKQLEELYLRGLSPDKPKIIDYNDKYRELPTTDKVLENKRKTIFKSGSGRVVLTAIAINGANSIAKCIAWLYTGSHAMFAEAIHSFADTLNQCILAYGIHHSLKNPNPDHPYGYTNFRYVTSLVSGVGIFCVGAGFSWYHGIAGLIQKTELADMYWAIGLLGVSFVSESFTLMMAFRNLQRKAKQARIPTYEYVARGQDPSVNVVLMEDLAAVVGVAVAGSCMAMSYVWHSHIPDAVGSIIVGTVLAGVSAFIIKTNGNALLGRSIPETSKKELQSALESDLMIRMVHDIKATDMGANLIKFKAEVDIDGRILTKKYLSELDLQELLKEMNSLTTTSEVEAFMLHHGEKVVELIGGEIDRIEEVLKAINPAVRHVDLELL